MKTIRKIIIFVISMLFALSVSSCQKIYSILIIGEWIVDADASYYVKNGGRRYFNEDKNYRGVSGRMQFFSNGEFEVTGVTKRGEHKKDVYKYHLDGDCLYSDGEAIHIIKLNYYRMVWESRDGDHLEFWRIRRKRQ